MKRIILIGMVIASVLVLSAMATKTAESAPLALDLIENVGRMAHGTHRATSFGCAYGNYGYYPTRAVYESPITVTLTRDSGGAGDPEVILKLITLNDKANAALIAEKDKTIAMYQALLEKGGLPPELKALLAPRAEHPGGKLMRDCASCHSAEDGAKGGKGHVFFKDGGMTTDPDIVKAMTDEIVAGRMPKGPKTWSDKDRLQAMSFIATRPDVPKAETAKKVDKDKM